jgi:hypothetical protein
VTGELVVSLDTTPIILRTHKRKRVYTRQPLVVRFWARVDTNGPVPPHRPELGPCAVWTGACDGRFGYGVIRNAGKYGQLLKAHRVSWAIHNGPLPDDIEVLHRCDNPPCVRGDHLFDGTQADNMLDCAQKGRAWNYRLHPECAPRGEKAGMAKLTNENIREIRRLRADGWTQARLGAAFGVTTSAIWYVLSGRTWKCVPIEEEEKANA